MKEDKKIIIPSAESITFKRLQTIFHKGKSFDKLQQRTKDNFLLVVHDLLTRGFHHAQIKRRNPEATKVPCSKNHWLNLIGDAQRYVMPLLESAQIIKRSVPYSNNPSKTKDGKAFGKSCKLMKELFADSWEFGTVEAKPRGKKDKESEPCAEMSRVLIDKEAALAALDGVTELRNWNIARKLCVFLQIEGFDEQNDVGSASTGREFNKVNMLPKNFRRFLSVDAVKDLMIIDVESCSARILSGWMKFVPQEEDYCAAVRKPCEKIAWLYWLRHDFYEQLVAISGGKLKDRDHAKLDFCSFTGGAKRTKSEKIIEKVFPKFAAKLQRIQASETKRGEVQRRIQMEESAVFVDAMGKEKFFAASLHDGSLIKRCDLIAAEKVIATSLPNAVITQEAV